MKSNFSIPCTTAYLKDVRTFVRDVLKEIMIADDLSNLIILAVDEACTNIIVHGNDNNKNATLKLEINKIKDELTIKLMDTGDYQPDYSFLKKDILQECIRKRKKGGLGMFIMYKVMDKVEYVKEKNNNFCLLHKTLPTK